VTPSVLFRLSEEKVTLSKIPKQYHPIFRKARELTEKFSTEDKELKLFKMTN
jgi:hypothetical protein